MKHVLLGAALLLSSCGNSATDIELTGQLKAAGVATNLICPDYFYLDMSMGVIKDGTGSVSKDDIFVTLYGRQEYKKYQELAKVGAIITVHANMRRAAFCTETYIMIKEE